MSHVFKIDGYNKLVEIKTQHNERQKNVKAKKTTERQDRGGEIVPKKDDFSLKQPQRSRKSCGSGGANFNLCNLCSQKL